MYFEEEIIKGILHFRVTPNEPFRAMSKEGLTHRIQILEARIKNLEKAIDALEANQHIWMP